MVDSPRVDESFGAANGGISVNGWSARTAARRSGRARAVRCTPLSGCMFRNPDGHEAPKPVDLVAFTVRPWMPSLLEQSEALPLAVNVNMCRAEQAMPPIVNAAGQIIGTGNSIGVVEAWRGSAPGARRALAVPVGSSSRAARGSRGRSRQAAADDTGNTRGAASGS